MLAWTSDYFCFVRIKKRKKISCKDYNRFVGQPNLARGEWYILERKSKKDEGNLLAGDKVGINLANESVMLFFVSTYRRTNRISASPDSWRK